MTTLAPLIAQVQAATASRTPLRIEGGGTKAFYGGATPGEPLSTRTLQGITAYEPSELFVTVRAGTPLEELEARLLTHRQHLAFEPPRFGPGGTVGGMVAAGLSGPARVSAGALRDHVLGATLLNGRGEVLRFGGQVMKNVAGFDVARLLAGSLGALGVILDITLKVMPEPAASATLRFEWDESTALKHLAQWRAQPLPIDASAWWSGMLVLRLRGAQAAVHSAMQTLGGELIARESADAFWRGLRDQQDEFFTGARQAVAAAGSQGVALWRLSLPATAPALDLPGELLIEWGGMQRWVCTPLPAARIRELARQLGGHATLFRGSSATRDAQAVFGPLPAPLDRIHRDLKAAFDPSGIFNPGALFAA